jgi:hypothetical protein
VPTLTGHPCADHPCDHCYVCDVLGVCCASISPEQRAQLEAAAQACDAERFRQAIMAEAGQLVTLANLISAEASRHVPALLPGSSRLALPPGVSSDAIPANSLKEAIYVPVARKA